MKNFYFLSLLIFITLCGAKAQTFYFTPSDTIRVDSTVLYGLSDVDMVGAIYNNTSSPLQVKWKRVNFTIPHGWDQNICDNYQCYGPAALTQTHTTNPIMANNPGLFKMAIKSNCVAGDGVVQVRVWVPGDSANTSRDLTFMPTLGAAANCANVTGIEEHATAAVLSLFPNPTTGIVHLKESDNYNNLRAVVFNVLGNKVLEADMSNSKVMNLQNLAQGVYMVKLYDDNKLLGVRKLQKSE
ncbi:MAG: T9SS type A sorting domain-containing protein [Chitinophagales bacterium]